MRYGTWASSTIGILVYSFINIKYYNNLQFGLKYFNSNVITSCDFIYDVVKLQDYTEDF